MSERRRFPLEITVFVVGAACLGAEIAAARLLAPWFGASTIVWANTIATVLVALSIGYAVGGRLADRNPTVAGLSRIVLVASVLLALVPLVSEPLLRASVSAFANLSVGTFLGSLLGVSALVAVPLFLLGTVTPYALRLKLGDLEHAGTTAGRLSAIGTAGSLVGTFAAALLLIPLVGTRRTFFTFALLLALVAIPGLSRRVVGVVTATALALLFAVPAGVGKSGIAGERVVWQADTTYQYARVLQNAAGTRTLELNEGQAVHSVYTPGRWLTGGYWDQMLALAWSGARAPRSVAILGSAAGTTARALGHYSPGTRVDAVELDPQVTAVGQRLFDLHGPHLHLHTADARPWLETQARRWDVIMVDAYRQPYIPFYLATREFFALCRQHLNPGGVVVVNVGHPPGSDALEKALTATMETSFAQVRRDPAEATNTMLVAGDRPPVAHVPTALAGVPLSLGAALRGGPVWTDDKAPVEWLVDLSLADVGLSGRASG